MSTFELCFSIRKKIAFDLINLFHVQIQKATRGLTTMRAFVFPAKLYYHKIFETMGQVQRTPYDKFLISES